MNKESIVLITKDALCCDYLPIYGNSIWHTPNIDELAKNGTVFLNYFSAASSTVMAFYSMITGLFSHETEFNRYTKSNFVYKGDTIFTKARLLGFESHMLWEKGWNSLKDYFDCYRNDVTIHSISNVKQGVGSGYKRKCFLEENVDYQKTSFEIITNSIAEILSSENKIFLWIHLPHVIRGCTSYGSDVEELDKIVGFVRTIVSDNNIYISADHGNMNGHKGKIGYGFDVYNTEIKIPLITPRINNYICDYNVSSVDLFSIIFEKKIPRRTFIYSDTAFKAQRHRKMAIIYNNYKYIYNKKTKKEELYDFNFDRDESFSLISNYIFDIDRKGKAPSREYYYYPSWDKLEEVRDILRSEKKKVWRNGPLFVTFLDDLKELIKPIYVFIRRKKE